MIKQLFLKGGLLLAAFLLLPSVMLSQVCGTTVYDTGGALGFYNNNENYTVTYCPPVAGQAVVLTFTEFNTEANWDLLSVHNGPTNGSPQFGVFSGMAIPGTFTSTDPSGCLTIWFRSDGSIFMPGWAINITCVPLAPPPSPCGSMVYDTGGPSGNYTNFQNNTVTYCPTVPGDVVTLNFTAFGTETCCDFLTVFNGNSTGSPVMGTFSGTGLPGSFTSTHPSGCITLQFTSDGSVIGPGWAAAVSCGTPPTPPVGDCVYVLTLQDSFGDGWGSSSVGVSINGGANQFYTVGLLSNQVLIGVNVGDLVILTYNNSGPWQGENSYALSLSSGGSLFNSGTPPTNGIAYAGTVDCIPPPAPPEDCIGATTICSSQAFNANTSSTGSIVDLGPANQGCLGTAERQGTWYSFSPTNTGTVAFTISPSDPFDDYDFAIWGPYPPGTTTATACPPAGAPLRCSFAAPSGDTGLNFAATDLSEPPSGDKWVRFISALPDQVFLLYVSNFSQSGLAFSLDWNPAMTADLDCTVLPVELGALLAIPDDPSVNVDWTTMSQQSVARFVVQRSADGRAFAPLGFMDAGDDSFVRKDYRFVDNAPIQGLNFYRLVTVGTDGSEELSDVVTARMGATEPVLVPNPASGMAVLYTGRVAATGSLLRITDASGRMVQETVIVGEALQHNVDMAGFSSGVYMISLHSADGAPLGHSRFVRE